MVVRLRAVPALGRQLRASFARRSATQRLVAWALAVVGSVVLALALLPLRSQLGLAGYLFFTLLIVVVAAVLGGTWPALAGVAIGLVAGAFFFAAPYESLNVDVRVNNIPLIAYLIVGVTIGLLVRTLAALAEDEANLRQVETALRRIATLAARGAPAEELFAAATRAVGELLGATSAQLIRGEPDGTSTSLARWEAGDRTGSASDATVGRSVSAPIVVDGQAWGVMTADLGPDQARSSRIDVRLERFTELLATAIAAAQSRDELTASRTRIVTAADDARRRIERDLHDGAQQRLVSLALRLRIAQRRVPAQAPELDEALSNVADELSTVIDELREMARGIHPAILAQGGLDPALRTLSRRSEVPVEIDTKIQGRLTDQVEVAAYYIVSETLTNVAKHAQAAHVKIEAAVSDGKLRVTVCDDGVGGADASGGSGLTGLADRVQALGGTFSISSPPGGGTTLAVELPLGRI
jgi:signal transduction histidine kinase